MPFRDIVGHARVVTLLSRAVARNTLPPALLFAGPAGVGKRRVAIAVAEALNCLDPKAGTLERDACGACASCRRIARGVHPDVVVVEPGDSGSIRIEPIREVIDRAGFRPFEGRRRVVIIDEADAMVAQAQNALLKTLEEPPPASVFLLVSSLADALLPTVRSRCPRLRFAALSVDEVVSVLTRDHEFAAGDARAAADAGDGSVSGALAASSSDVAASRDTAARLLGQVARGDDPARRIDAAKLLAPARTLPPGVEREQLAVCLRAMASLLRDLSMLDSGLGAGALANADMADHLGALARSFDARRSARAYAAVDEALAALERNASPKVVADWLALEL
jgi:DNA polymerase-3 subunit delta'